MVGSRGVVSGSGVVNVAVVGRHVVSVSLVAFRQRTVKTDEIFQDKTDLTVSAEVMSIVSAVVSGLSVGVLCGLVSTILVVSVSGGGSVVTILVVVAVLRAMGFVGSSVGLCAQLLVVGVVLLIPVASVARVQTVVVSVTSLAVVSSVKTVVTIVVVLLLKEQREDYVRPSTVSKYS